MDSSKGYTVPNVVTSCWDCNGAKMALTVPDFAAKVNTILAHQERPSTWTRPVPKLVTLPDLEARARTNPKKAVMTAAPRPFGSTVVQRSQMRPLPRNCEMNQALQHNI